MITNHYGKWVDSESPVTGVINANNISWEWVDDEICLTCEEIQESIENDESLSDEDKENELEFMECDSSHTRLLGDWIKDDEGLYDADRENGEFAAIENESTVQVVWSKYLVKGNPCSPCYPGQIDINSDSTMESGQYLAYTLPDYLLYKGV